MENNITFTAQLKTDLVSHKVAQGFRKATRNLPQGDMYLYPEKIHGQNYYIASLQNRAKDGIRLEVTPFTKQDSELHQTNILSLCYKLLQRETAYAKSLSTKKVVDFIG